ncbi:hypothetical protein PROFUN_07466 [Planoprotostelium fungivorum]|uniref:Pyridoxamine 5'-phosphate oxidase N-terminal domain-containing protein n=1 Tax=Planoprotostelium fungivorum TaxID=1890364 RepID=A0A2P6NLK9_9EUKA|nr:hypothetical protein PROFUN_07466 [Planoprotostelium fungivorum]
MTTSGDIVGRFTNSPFHPPKEVLFLLENCSLAFLATANRECKPEQSIMFFTWDPQDKVIIFVTPRELKYRNIVENSNVCVLLHSFEGAASTRAAFESVLPVTINIYATAQTATGETEERYRKLHMERHPKYSGAFQGEDKAVVYCKVNNVRLVTVKGEIAYWSKEEVDIIDPTNIDSNSNIMGQEDQYQPQPYGTSHPYAPVSHTQPLLNPAPVYGTTYIVQQNVQSVYHDPYDTVYVAYRPRFYRTMSPAAAKIFIIFFVFFCLCSLALAIGLPLFFFVFASSSSSDSSSSSSNTTHCSSYTSE